MSDWYRPGSYSYDEASKDARDAAARAAAKHGPRTYSRRSAPDMQLVDPKKRIASTSKNPMIIAVDVTGSMQQWPFEIFDRLPLLYNTLAQYRDDLEVSFAAIGDAGCDRWPLQVTDFGKGYDLEKLLNALYGEGGGGDEPESYGVFARFANTHVSVPHAKRPFLIVFGDAPMHRSVPGRQIKAVLGDKSSDRSAIEEWNTIARSWNTWFLRRPGGRRGDSIDQQWAEAIGAQQVVHMADEQRAVDYAMGLVARLWGHFDDFKENMSARHDESRVIDLEKRLDEIKPRLLSCPSCAAPIPISATGRFVCTYCRSSLTL